MKFPVQAFYDWYRQTLRNPQYRWWVIAATFAYLASPFDFLPDFLPIIGQLDDILLVTLLISEVSQLVIDRVKSSKGVYSTPTDETNSTVDGESVDVNAVSID